MKNIIATRNIIVGTAGHIDHGKTALVKALTGTDAERLAGKERGRMVPLADRSRLHDERVWRCRHRYARFGRAEPGAGGRVVSHGAASASARFASLWRDHGPGARG